MKTRKNIVSTKLKYVYIEVKQSRKFINGYKVLIWKLKIMIIKKYF